MADILVIGSGGREHALTSKLSESAHVKNIVWTKNCSINIKNHKDVLDFCQEHAISLVAIGPEDPLADGLTDTLEKSGIKVFGPSKLAARIESSKEWAKNFMKKHSIPTANYKVFSDVQSAKDFIESSTWSGFAIKGSGLAGGKGVYVVDDKTSACEVLDSLKSVSGKYRDAFQTIVIEEKLIGFEVSVLAFTDGKTIKLMPPAQDHKPRFAGNLGPNTGGMGAYAPCPLLSKEDLEYIKEHILQKTVDEMRNEGCPYVGTLYAGIMVTNDGPKVLEFNCRFGDPETQCLMLLLKSDLFQIMKACTNGTLHETDVHFLEDQFAACVNVVVKNYPGDVKAGMGLEIEGLNSISENSENKIFLAGVKKSESGHYVTSGGRVLNVCSVSRSLEKAVIMSQQRALSIKFKNAPVGYEADIRCDIAFQGVKKIRESQCGKLSYESAGVDINKGNFFVKNISNFCKKTHRDGVKSDLGMFGAVFDTKLAGYKDALQVSGTDGVGTKVKLAIDFVCHEGIGQDLVAMCVNDILTHGAEPLYFLDYLAFSRLESETKIKVVEGIAKACSLAGCALVGGETAEMPDMYTDSHYDLAGFAVGAVEREHFLPATSRISAGDYVIGVTSSGLHSNGFSLVRKIIDVLDLNASDPAYFMKDSTLGSALLKPTLIYTPLLNLLRSGKVLAAAHITGGGIEENLLRVVPDGLGVHINKKWGIPAVFSWIAFLGVSTEEMLKTFNLGIGFMLIVKKENVESVLLEVQRSFIDNLSDADKPVYPCANSSASDSGLEDFNSKGCWVVGNLSEFKDEEKRLKIEGINESLAEGGSLLMSSHPTKMLGPARKRVAVMISGSGTNLQALLDHTLSGPSSAEIVLVISNVAGVEGLERAKRANVKTMVFPHKNFASRQLFDEAVDACLREHDVEYVFLAGFMRILSAFFVKKWSGRLVNIHPSLLPSFRGKDAQQQALDARVYLTGCTVHFVVEQVDAGGIIAQASVTIHMNDTVETLTERIKEKEHVIYPKVMELVARGKIYLGEDGKVVRTKNIFF